MQYAVLHTQFAGMEEVAKCLCLFDEKTSTVYWLEASDSDRSMIVGSKIAQSWVLLQDGTEVQETQCKFAALTPDIEMPPLIDLEMDSSSASSSSLEL